ncbi:glycosyl hydrolase 115 family protein [Geofilum sp. OHC36d9]|uniref:glycosyl hydrolase 115 family protein n=1 Tax=Geofilum sp. OHC36d9 TaxID=3458413 RepID=UPI0040337D67
MKYIFINLLLIPQLLFAQLQVSHNELKNKDYFPIVNSKTVATIVYDTNDYSVVKKTSELFSSDIELISEKLPTIVSTDSKLKNNIIIIGTIGKNKLIDQLIAEKKLDVADIKGQWERYTIQTFDKPFKGVKKALVIAGSDKRGTAYGVFTVSEKIGVSPWYWWADVPAKKSKELYVSNNTVISKQPSVKYRGIFINDEDWGLHPWAGKNMDKDIADIGPNTYEKIFELLLRLKGNIMAPAMHECTKAFYTVPGNMEMANKYGIMITTSHCEPLLYNNASEWDKKKQGNWNYVTNKNEIVKALDSRVKQAYKNDNIYTIALRGMHDSKMEAGSEEEKLQTLSEAIKDQRSLLSKYINKPLTEIPQIFVPYKEVLSIYEMGLKLPEEITIVWPDDNYGYIKRLSNKDEQKRKGGAGVYYHISYLGWPNDYLWLNTTPPALMYAEMQKAYELGAQKYWLLNVGDIKPGEMGMQLFLDMAWDMDQFNFENINDYQVNFLSSIFGEEYKKDFKHILDRYYFHGFTRKPEFMTWDWRWNSLFHTENVKDTEFSFINYNEAESRLNEYKAIANQAETILNQLPQEKKAAFFELVYYPVKGASLYNHEMLIGQKNRWYAKQNRSTTNILSEKVKQYHDSLAILTDEYNSLLNGKWNGMMTAPGFLPKIQLSPTRTIELPQTSEMGIFVEGQKNDSDQLTLPEFNNRFNETHFVEVYNNSTTPLKWQASTSEKWIKINISEGETTTQERILVSIDWDIIPTQKAEGYILVSDGTTSTRIQVKASSFEKDLDNLFVPNDGVISISPVDFQRKKENGNIKFQKIEGLGYTNSSLQLGNAKYNSGMESFVEYDFYASKSGETTIYTYMLPLFAKDTFHSTRYGIQVDDMEITTQKNDVKEYSHQWAANVIRNSAINKTKIFLDKPGKHTLRIYSIDPGMIIQKIMIDFGGLKKSYLGAVPANNN